MTRRPIAPISIALRAAVLLGTPLLAACGGSGAQPGAPRPETLMQPGISRELAQARAATLSDVRYELWLDLTQRDSA
ncbi:MAG TPA: hypothetical protein VF541_06735, partial [Longimicrobium sp.]